MRCLLVDLIRQMFHAIVSHRDLGTIKAVGLDDVRASLQIAFVDGADDVRLLEYKQIVITLHIICDISEACAAVVAFGQLIILDLGAHRPIQKQHPRF